MATSVPPTPVQLAEQARQRLVSLASGVAKSLLDKVQERLSQLMDEAAPSREMQLRRDAWMAFQSARSRWLENTVKSWQGALKPDPKPSRPAAPLSLEFELVDTQAVENKIIASRMALDLMEKSAKPVNDLRRRLKFLNQEQALAERDIVHPEALCLALVEQWQASGLPADGWKLVAATVQNHLSAQLPAAYEACNAELIRQGVLPDIDTPQRPVLRNSGGLTGAAGLQPAAVGAPVSAPMPMAAPASAVPPLAQAVGPTGGPPSAPVPAARALAPGMGAQIGVPAAAAGQRSNRVQNIFSQVGRFLSGAFLEGAPAAQAQPSGPQPGWPGDAQFVAQAPAPAAAAPYPVDGAAYGAAYGAVYGAAPGGPGAPMPGQAALAPGVYGGLSAPLRVALAQQAPLPDVPASLLTPANAQAMYPVLVAQMASDLRQQSSELKSKAVTDSEKAIIELVALMFQAILQEDRITPGARVWFARLQMPVLRLALEDPEFFSQGNHPARQLIDHMGACVMGFDASGISSQEMETEIKRVVQVIEQYPETGDKVYRRVYEEFQVFLKKHLAKKPTAQKVLGVAEQLEHKETLTIQYTIELREQLKDMPVREEVRSFLFKVWSEVLAISTVRLGKLHETTQSMKKAATDLIWAASSKPNRADRARVIAGLPGMLQALRDGMGMLGLAAEMQESHIKLISDTLADAFMSKTAAIDDAQIRALAQRLAELDDYVDSDSGVELPLDTQDIEDLLGFEASALDVISAGGGPATPVMLMWAADLALGSWFALQFQNTTLDVQYVWRSPLGHLHLFANQAGHSYLFQTLRLAAYLQAGLLEPQEDEPLTARAARSALNGIQGEPSRLLA